MHDHILEALRRGDTAQALAAAHAAVAAGPNDALAHRLLAITQQTMGEPAQALTSIDHAIALAPDDAEAHLVRARLLLAGRQLQAASDALKTTTALDPNQFSSYVLQALIALGRNDLAEAVRVNRLASLLLPDHPYVVAVEGMVALQRGDDERACTCLSAAVQQLPEDPLLRNALGFAYLARGHLAFAEQAFRGVIDAGIPEGAALRPLLADLMRRQGRLDDALAEIAPLLTDAALVTPALQRFAGELALMAKRPRQALPWLQAAFAGQPEDRRTLRALVQAWRDLGQPETARENLEAALLAQPLHADLWRARLAFEAFGSPEAEAVLERWLAALPSDTGALEASAALHDHRGDAGAADAALQRILAIDPGHARARARHIDSLLERAPATAIVEIQQLLADSDNPETRRQLRGWQGFAQDRAGHYADAAQTWIVLQSETTQERAAFPRLSAPRDHWPDAGRARADAPAVTLLWGAPGSAVEQIARGWAALQLPFCTDRFGPAPPQDGFSDADTATRLAAAAVDAAGLVTRWRDGLVQRGIADGQVVDWLPYWDNALLLALRPHLPEAVLLLVVRDPRDMLLDWLAFGAPVQIGLASPSAAAQWLARMLEQIVVLHERDLYPHRLLRLDEAIGDPHRLAVLVGQALDTPLPEPALDALGAARFAAGHWRAYAQALAEPFALLAPVARRLGYAEA